MKSIIDAPIQLSSTGETRPCSGRRRSSGSHCLETAEMTARCSLQSTRPGTHVGEQRGRRVTAARAAAGPRGPLQ
eukprot:1824258-Prymnesium_polylepis.1